MLVIIGTGLAGYMLAKEWRKLDKQTPLTLITAGTGAFYSKPLLSTALSSAKTPEQLVINAATQMAEQLNATILTHTQVTSIDRVNKKVMLGKAVIAYDQLVFACGAKPLDLSLAGDGAVDVLSVNNLDDYAVFRQWLANRKKQLAILGSGLVGCEFASDLLAAGYQIEMISLEAAPLAKLVPAYIGKALQTTFAENNVRWHLNVAATAVYKTPSGYRVELSSGESVLVDGVLSAVGLLPNQQLAQSAGLTVGQGIVVNRQLATSDPNIFALGDCANVAGHLKQYVAPLLQCARTLATVLHTGVGAVHYPSMPVVVKTPLCPLVAVPVPADVEGEWHYHGEGRHLSALFYDEQQQLRGFGLSGDKVKDKLELVKKLPPVFVD